MSAKALSVISLRRKIGSLMALFGHPTCTDECPLLGVKQTFLATVQLMPVYDTRPSLKARLRGC
jgi:hypothetical protein